MLCKLEPVSESLILFSTVHNTLKRGEHEIGGAAQSYVTTIEKCYFSTLSNLAQMVIQAFKSTLNGSLKSVGSSSALK